MAAPLSRSALPTPDEPPGPPRRIPLSLRMFAAVLVLLGVGSGLWIGVPAWQQYNVVRGIEPRRGHVETVERGPEWMRNTVGHPYLDGVDKVVAVNLQGERVDDAALVGLSKLPDVERLYLNKARITDQGLSNLRSLSNLRFLDLGETAITDVGLSHLAGLSKLESLFLDGTAITNRGIVHLEHLTSLKELYVFGTQLDDDGLKSLKELKGLKYLSVQGTKISEVGVTELQRDLPGIEVIR